MALPSRMYRNQAFLSLFKRGGDARGPEPCKTGQRRFASVFVFPRTSAFSAPNADPIPFHPCRHSTRRKQCHLRTSAYPDGAPTSVSGDHRGSGATLGTAGEMHRHRTVEELRRGFDQQPRRRLCVHSRRGAGEACAGGYVIARIVGGDQKAVRAGKALQRRRRFAEETRTNRPRGGAKRISFAPSSSPV